MISLASYADIYEFNNLTGDEWKVGLEKVEGTTPGPSESQVEFELQQASRDIDAYLGWDAPTEAGLRIDTEDLSEYEYEQLVRATVCQAIYRLTLGEGLMVDPTTRHIQNSDTLIRVPGPYLGPAAQQALAGAGLYRRSGSAPPDEPEGEP